MNTRRRLWALFCVIAALAALPMITARGQSHRLKPDTTGASYTTWSDYGGSADSMQYSALKQINKTNVAQLRQAWFYPVSDRTGAFSFNPIVVDGVMYVLGRNNSITALDAATGKDMWTHVPEGGSPGARGISYWENKDRSDRRLIFGAGGTIRAIDAKTGNAIPTFGENGRVATRVGELRPLGGPPPTAGRVFENLYIAGSGTGETYGSPPGDIRAFDVVSGKLIWTFHTIPYPGEFGYDTWPEGAYKWAGGVNNWGEMSVDERRGLIYVPLGSPTHDSYGGDRKGANLFGNSLVALDARTGKRLWHFQMVHHDLWDYDLTTAPKLLTIRHNGKPVDIVAQPSKHGFLYVFNRVTGEPIWPIEERPVPKSDVPGEQSYPTQPFPTKPAPYARLDFNIEEINPHVDEAEREILRERLRNARNEGVFTPQTLTREQISVPGEFGGSNWGGSAADPTSGWIYVRSVDTPAIHRLRVPGVGVSNTPGGRGRAIYMSYCEACHGDVTPRGIQSYDGAGVVNIQELGTERVATAIRQGMGPMPAHTPDVIDAEQLEWLLTYLFDPASSGGRGGGAGSATRNNQRLPFVEGLTRYTGPLGSVFRASNGLPAIAPPWASIVAYDLNEGVIKWRTPLGIVRALAAKGIKDTGNPVRLHRNGLVATAGGLIFVGTNGDGFVRAFDKDTGKVLWEHDLNANPEGLPSVFDVNGRQYVVFTASYYASLPQGNISTFQGKIENQGYYVFGLP